MGQSVTIATVLLVLLLPIAKAALRFKSKKSEFRIVQFTDVHLGEQDGMDASSQDVGRLLAELRDLARWGRAGSTPRRCLQVLARVLEAEAAEGGVDLVVLSGDMVSGYAWNGSEGWYAGR
jgi:predicted MPP superfamily phosphohydrolase